MNRRVLVACCAISLALGCADVFGLGDYTEQDGGPDATATDATPDSTPDSSELEGGGDADASDAVTSDADDSGDAGDGAVTTVCTGVCVPPLPSGWTFVAYDRAFRPSCSTGYGTPTDVEEGLSAGAATCACTCATAAPSCSSIAVTAGDAGTNGCNNQTTQTVTTDGGCTSMAALTTQGEKMSATVTPTGGGCTPDASVSVPAVSYAYQGRICEPLGAPGGGCDAGVCFPPPSPYGLCVYQAGAVACPTGYPVQYGVGSTVTDTRGCSACTCGYDGGTCGGNVTFYTGTTCNLQSQTITADGTCQAVTNQTFKGFQYAPSATGASCTPSATTPTGDAGFADLATVCCTQ